MSFSWFAVQVNQRSEFRVKKALQSKGYETLLPLFRENQDESGCAPTILQPLFPSYVFCCFDVIKRLPVLVTPGVVRIVGAGRHPIPVDTSELDAIRTVVESGLSTRPAAHIRIGQKVRVERGPLRGIEGIIVEHKNSQRLILGVSLLQRSLSVGVELEWLSAIEARPFQNASYTPSRLAGVGPCRR